ncbi:MAG TPA: hypothetical protein PKJ87_06050, partial [Macellibacteroides fermentans]|nr:hypothetical protein [Macellibacteroides fermentans]
WCMKEAGLSPRIEEEDGRSPVHIPRRCSAFQNRYGNCDDRIALQIHDGGGIKVLWRNLVVKTL